MTRARDPGPRSLSELLARRVESSGAKLAATHKVAGKWQDVTWTEVGARVGALAQGLIGQGIQRGDRVAIFAATSLDWCIADLAIGAVGAMTVPIYASSTPEECRFVLQDSGARALFVDGDPRDREGRHRLEVAREICAQLPELALIAFGCLEETGVAAGSSHALDLTERQAATGPDDPACVIYTSGTTGTPKGVVLTHGAWLYEARAIGELELLFAEDVVLLFLPMAHSFGKLITAAWLGVGFTLAFCERVEKLMEYLVEVRPTVLPAVPRVFEKVYFGVVHQALASPGLRGRAAALAMREFEAHAAALGAGRARPSLGFRLARALVLRRIAVALRQRLGGRVRMFVSGSAPLDLRVARFFQLCGLAIYEGYGLTETSAAATGNRPAKHKLGTVGPPLPGTQLQVAGDGEIVIKGPGVMKEYFHNPAATQAAFTPDGWLRTGDIGEVDAEGFVHITDRRKDLIKTSGGNYVAPQKLEGALRSSPLVSQAMVHGDQRKYITALLTVNEEASRAFLSGKGKGSPAAYPDLSRDPDLRAEVARVIGALNATLPSHEAIRKFRILDHDLTLESGELTPTFKVKRGLVTQRYRDLLDSMYSETEPYP